MNMEPKILALLGCLLLLVSGCSSQQFIPGGYSFGRPLGGHPHPSGNVGGDPMHQNGKCMAPGETCSCYVYVGPNCLWCQWACLSTGMAGTTKGLALPTTQSPATEVPTTAAPPTTVAKTTAPLTTPTTAVPSTSSPECVKAATVCTANCPGGYFVDPDDCTYCICKSDVITG